MGEREAASGAVWSRRRARAAERARDAAAVAGRNVVRLVIGCGILLILGVIGAVALMVNQHREHVLQSTERELSNTVLLLARHFDQQISTIRDEEREFSSQVRAMGITTPEAFSRAMTSPQIHAVLQERVDSASGASIMCVYDADGRLVNWSKTGEVGNRSIADKPYFRSLKSRWNEPFTIELIDNPLLGGWVIVAARRIDGPDGEFLGVVAMGIMPATLEGFFASVMLNDSASITLLKQDGLVLARVPHVPGGFNVRNRKLSGLLDLAERDGQGVLRIKSPVDDQFRIAAVKALTGYPIVVAASITEESALAGWHEQTRFQVGAAAFIALIIVAMLAFTVQQITRQHRAARQRLAEEKLRLDTAINNMAQGLLMFGADTRLIVCNQRYLDMFGMSSDVIKPGSTLREILVHRKACGYFPGNVDNYCAWFDTQLRSGLSAQSILEPGDGRVFQYIYQPLADGGWLTTVEDITARRSAEAKIAHLAHYDPLTDLPNRVLFRERLERELAALGDDSACAVLYIDIDEFKSINDSLGHPAGDELLKTVARRLRDCVGKEGFVARLGGDEFAVVQYGAADRDAVTALVNRLHGVIRAPCDCFGHQIVTDASIGVAIAPQHGDNLDVLLKHADLAMYAAKADGRRTWRLFEPEMDARVKLRQQLEQDLRAVISANGDFAGAGFEIHYQPVVCLRDGHVAGCEALLRWNHPLRGRISPAEFIPVAEDTGLITQLGEWVLSTACREAAQWPENVRIAVNVSPVQFRSPTLALHVVAALAVSGLSPSRLELEITEAVLIRDDDQALAVLKQLRALGVRTALDDFGTGYSSLSYLQRFPFDKIKIDRAFVEHVADVDGSASIVQAVVNIAASRAMITTAEGVETEAQRDRLRALGCSQMQGFLFSGARPAAEIRALLAGTAPTAATAARTVAA